METIKFFLVPFIWWLFLIAHPALGQGSLPVVQHYGSSDPTVEGFTLNGGGQVGPTNNDQGLSAWITATINNGSGPINYSHILTSQQQTEISGANWSLSATVRLVQSGSSGPVGVTLIAGSEGTFFLDFGMDSHGNPTVKTSASGTVIDLIGVGSTYNNYQLIYNYSTGTASLWVNGLDEMNNIAGNPDYGSIWSIDWGQGQGGPAQANWNLVSLTVPEPSAWSLILLGGGVFLYVRARKHHSA